MIEVTSHNHFTISSPQKISGLHFKYRSMMTISLNQKTARVYQENDSLRSANSKFPFCLFTFPNLRRYVNLCPGRSVYRRCLVKPLSVRQAKRCGTKEFRKSAEGRSGCLPASDRQDVADHWSCSPGCIIDLCQPFSRTPANLWGNKIRAVGKIPSPLALPQYSWL